MITRCCHLLIGFTLLAAPAPTRAGDGEADGASKVDEIAVGETTGDDQRSSAITDAAAKAIPYLWREGEQWIEKRGCVSCHQVPAMLWSLSSAERHGMAIDRDRLQKWKKWSVQPVNFVNPDQKENVDVDATLASNIDTMNGLLIALAGDDALDDQWAKLFADALVANQQPDGSWRACGQLPMQKRPSEETTQVTVLWTLLALTGQGVDVHDQNAALELVANSKPESTEWWTVRLLLAAELQDPQRDVYREAILARQNEDGGWGWLTSDASDALATGMARYALRATTNSKASDSAATSSAADYLIRTQRDDGSWSVPGTKKNSRDRPTPTSNYWGTAWAVIGLLE